MSCCGGAVVRDMKCLRRRMCKVCDLVIVAVFMYDKHCDLCISKGSLLDSGWLLG